MECWGDGSPIRDFVYGEDVADAIYQMYDKQINDIVNLGSAEEITIKYMVESLILASHKSVNITWDSTKPNGDLRRQMDITKQKKYDLLPETPFIDALIKTYRHYIQNFKIDGLPFIVNEYMNKSYYVGDTNEIFDDISLFHYHVDKLIDSSKDKKYYQYTESFANLSTHNPFI